MSVNLVQNFYKQTITTPWTIGLGNFYVSEKPTVSAGFLVISSNSESLREIVEYSATGTDGGGDYVTVSARGLGGTIEQAHAAQEKVYMNITAEHIQQIKESIEAISAAGALDASTTVKGVARLTADSNLTIGTVTMTIASPAVATFVAHGLTVNDQIQFTTTGALPTGVSPSTTYFVISTGLTADNFRFSATFGGAAINTSGSQSGTHTLTRVTPRAVSPNDPILPSQTLRDAFAGTPGTPNSTNKFVTQAVSVNAGATINGATLPVPVYQNTTDNEYYACDGNDLTALKFQGFAISNGTNGTAMLVQTNGIVGGFSALDEGVAYYLSDTAGAIQNTPGTYPVLVGIAISTTQLLIQKGGRYASGGAATSVGSTSGSTVVTCGFRPSKITINGYCASSGWYSSLSFLWVNGVISAIASFYNEASGGESSAIARLYEDNAADFMEFSITSVTNTGFTIVWTENGTFANPAFFMWSAEGDI